MRFHYVMSEPRDRDRIASYTSFSPSVSSVGDLLKARNDNAKGQVWVYEGSRLDVAGHSQQRCVLMQEHNDKCIPDLCVSGRHGNTA